MLTSENGFEWDPSIIQFPDNRTEFYNFRPGAVSDENFLNYKPPEIYCSEFQRGHARNFSE